MRENKDRLNDRYLIKKKNNNERKDFRQTSRTRDLRRFSPSWKFRNDVRCTIQSKASAVIIIVEDAASSLLELFVRLRFTQRELYCASEFSTVIMYFYASPFAVVEVQQRPLNGAEVPQLDDVRSRIHLAWHKRRGGGHLLRSITIHVKWTFAVFVKGTVKNLPSSRSFARRIWQAEIKERGAFAYKYGCKKRVQFSKLLALNKLPGHFFSYQNWLHASVKRVSSSEFRCDTTIDTITLSGFEIFSWKMERFVLQRKN